MVGIDNCGYLKRKTTKGSSRNWWLVKYNSKNAGFITLHTVMFPKHLIGKRVRFKVEVIEDV